MNAISRLCGQLERTKRSLTQLSGIFYDGTLVIVRNLHPNASRRSHLKNRLSSAVSLRPLWVLEVHRLRSPSLRSGKRHTLLAK